MEKKRNKFIIEGYLEYQIALKNYKYSDFYFKKKVLVIFTGVKKVKG